MEMLVGDKMYELCEKLFPICRSITGKGVRDTLQIINNRIIQDGGNPLCIREVPSGTQVYDWTVPKEWEIRDAYIEKEDGSRIIDFKENNLYVLGYSSPVDEWVELDELEKHIYTQPSQPEVIPYVTSYYKERYGFCMSENQKKNLTPGKYHMVIDSELFDGVLNYAELVIPGDSEKEVFFSTYFCHPSMANNECSGPVLAAELINFISHMKKRRYTYHFVMIPETIGSITYLSRDKNLEQLQRKMVAGFNLSCVGDNHDYSIVETAYGNTLADKVLKNVLSSHTRDKFSCYSFLERGSDERQYNAPGVGLPVVCFCRSKFGAFPEYHTSADNMSYVSPEGFQGAFDVMTQVIMALENNYNYKVCVLGEPQLGKRGLYPTVSQKGSYDEVMPLKHLIAYSDGKNDLIDISNIIRVPIKRLIPIVQKLTEHKLLEVVDG